MFCKNCGTQLKNEAKFCPRCGVPVVSQEMAAQQTQPLDTAVQQKKWKNSYTVLVLIGIFAVAIAAGFGIKAFRNTGEPDEAAISAVSGNTADTGRQKEPAEEDTISGADTGNSAVSQTDTEENPVSLTDETACDADLYPIPERTLRYTSGRIMSGDDIKYVQAALMEMNYSGLSVNGYYDSDTAYAVERFQKNHAYAQDGIVDAAMAQHIQSALEEWREKQSRIPELTEETSVDADLYPVPERKLYYRSDSSISGEDVKYVQAALIEMEYTGISVTGYYDSATAAAVKRFQRNHDLTVDGIVGDQTTAALQKYLAVWRSKH